MTILTHRDFSELAKIAGDLEYPSSSVTFTAGTGPTSKAVVNTTNTSRYWCYLPPDTTITLYDNVHISIWVKDELPWISEESALIILDNNYGGTSLFVYANGAVNCNYATVKEPGSDLSWNDNAWHKLDIYIRWKENIYKIYRDGIWAFTDKTSDFGVYGGTGAGYVGLNMVGIRMYVTHMSDLVIYRHPMPYSFWW